MNRYIIITPCKNEEKNLPVLVRSLAKQSVTPVLWAILDDGSTDRTPEIIQDAKNKYKWIENICIKKGCRDLTIHISEVINTGLNFAQNFCEYHDLRYDFIVFLDADMIIEDAEFFEQLITEFDKDKNLGIASGEIHYIDDSGNLSNPPSRSDTISGR